MANHKAHSNTQNTNMAAAAATSFMQKFSSPIISTATQSHVSPACLPVLVHSLPSRRLPGAALSGDARSSCLCSCLQQQQQQFSASPPRAASRTIACAATQSSRSNVDSVDVLQDLPTAAYGQVGNHQHQAVLYRESPCDQQHMIDRGQEQQQQQQQHARLHMASA